MRMSVRHWVGVYLVPAGVFQSVIVGGAYGTGREVVEFVSRYGALGGLLAIAAIAAGLSLVLGASFEFARVMRAYDYRSFLRSLLGAFWPAYEVFFLLLLVIVLAVTGAAAGTVLAETFGIERQAGTVFMLMAVVAGNFYGRRLVEMTLTAGAIALTVGLLAYGYLVASQAGGTIVAAVKSGEVVPGWLLSAGQFTLYNSALAPVLLYSTTQIATRGEAVTAAVLAALAGILPALILHLSFLARYPAALQQEIPAYWMIKQFGTDQFLWLYVSLLFMTIVQTGVGVLQGLNERLDAWYAETHSATFPKWGHALVAGGAVVLSLALARVGIVDLIAKGYGTLAWCFLVVFTIPVLSLGIARIRSESLRAREG